jgi:hypothetical protein
MLPMVEHSGNFCFAAQILCERFRGRTIAIEDIGISDSS